MVNVCILRSSPIIANGGINSHCVSLMNLLKGDDTIFILPFFEHRGWILGNKRICNFFKIKAYIANSGCDIAHVHGFMNLFVAPAIFAAVLCKKKILYTPHFHPFDTLEHPRMSRLYFKLFIRPLLRYVDKVVTLNDEDNRFWQQYGVDTVQIPHWSNIQTAPCQMAKKKNMLLFVGHNRDNKGIDHLLQLPKGKYEVHCVTNKFIREDFVHHYNISNEELSMLYQQASLLLVPSRYEAFSLVSLEAFANGTPVLMSDKVRIADYLGGLSGYCIFPYGDYQAFLSSIDETIGMEVDSKEILSIFSAERAKQAYKKLYIELITPL